MSLRSRARATARKRALDLLGARDSWTGRTRAALARPRVHMIYLHGVPRDELDRFRTLIDHLSAGHDFVSHSEAVSMITSGRTPTVPTMSISFDDGFISNVEAAKVLAERGISGCFFLPPDFIGTRDTAAAHRYFRTKEGVETAMSWDDVDGLLAEGHEVGNHTRRHHNLATLDAAQTEDEIAGGREVLRSRTGAAIDHFAWPLGRFQHFTEKAARSVYSAGHSSCASAVRGAHPASHPVDRPCLRRDHIMTSWPMSHTLHFLTSSALGASNGDNAWPVGWDVAS